MLFSKEAAQANVRNRDGKRVFYLAKGDQLTSEAKEFLLRERIEILPAEKAKPERYRLLSGGFLEEKPEYMTHLYGDVLVEKTHPRIAFRGMVDTLEAEILLCQAQFPQLLEPLEEILSLARKMIRCDVLNEALPPAPLGGLDEKALRAHSHRPQEFYGQPHFMPSASDGQVILQLNRLRTLVRQTERSAAAALPERTDILQALNRMSSFVYILMIREKGK